MRKKTRHLTSPAPGLHYLKSSRHQCGNEIIEALEQESELNWLAAHLRQQTHVESAHHRPNEHDWHCPAKQRGHQSDAQKQPVTIFDGGPSSIETFDGRNDSVVKRGVGCHFGHPPLLFAFPKARRLPAPWHGEATPR